MSSTWVKYVLKNCRQLYRIDNMHMQVGHIIWHLFLFNFHCQQALGISILERLQTICGNKQDIADTINKSTVLVNKTSSASNMTTDEQPKTPSVTNIDSETNMNVPRQYKKNGNTIKGSKNTKAKPISERTSEAVENSQSESMEDATRLIAIEQVMSLSTSQATPASAEVVPVGM